jgi:hypothetical protein
MTLDFGAKRLARTVVTTSINHPLVVATRRHRLAPCCESTRGDGSRAPPAVKRVN